MKNKKSENTLKLVNIYLEHHKAVLIFVEERQGTKPDSYKDLEVNKLERVFNDPPSEKRCLLDFATCLMSNLLRMHSLPNTNHRTTIHFIRGFLKANDIDLPEYDISTNIEKWVENCNAYIHESKYWLKLSKERSLGNKEIDVGGWVIKKIKKGDLKLTTGEIRNKHRKVTEKWLKDMLPTQSTKCSKDSLDSLSRFIAQSDKSKSSTVT
jgi:prophage maintenance system killer protein